MYMVYVYGMMLHSSCQWAAKSRSRTVVSAITASSGSRPRSDYDTIVQSRAAGLRSRYQGNAERTHTESPELTAEGQQQGDWLAKVLAAAGVASRRNCIELVKQGAVKVNGRIVTDPATKVDPSKDVLAVQDRTIKEPSAVVYHYFAVNKPPGYICSNTSTRAPGKRAVDVLQPWLQDWQQKHPGQLPPRLFTVGRLDVATSGLIFITNDGDWANKVIHPSANIIKEYHVTLSQPPTPLQLQLLRAGTIVEGVHCQPKLVQMLKGPSSGSSSSSRRVASSSSSSSRSNSGSGRCVVRVDVSEGKKHEVRLLVAAAGLELLALKRTRVGGFAMPRNLHKAGYINLEPKDLVDVFQQPSK